MGERGGGLMVSMNYCHFMDLHHIIGKVSWTNPAQNASCKIGSVCFGDLLIVTSSLAMAVRMSMVFAVLLL